MAQEYVLTVSRGYIAISEELQLDEDVAVGIHGTVVKREETTNNDGTKRIIYTIKGIIATVVKTSGEAIEVQLGNTNTSKRILD